MKKKFWKTVLAVFCVLALTAGILPTAFASEEGEYIYVNGEAKVFTAAGELSAILRLPVEVPGRIHILTSGVNISLAIYDEETFELFGVYYTENGLIDVPFDAYPGTFLLGFSGWGEVAVLVADEGTTAQLYANAQAAEEPVEEWVEKPEEEYIEESAEELTEETEEVPAEATEKTIVEEPVEEAEAVTAEEPAEGSIEESAETSLTPMKSEDVLQEEYAEETVEASKEESVEEPVEEPVEETEEYVETAAEELTEEPVEVPEAIPEEAPVETEVSEDVTVPPVEVEEPDWEPEEELEKPADEMPAEEPEDEPVYYDPAVPIDYEFTGSGTVSVLSILNGVGAPVNMVMEVTRETDGFFSAFGGSDGDWRLTPFAYFDEIEVSVRAGYYNAADGSIKEAVYTLILSYPDPAQPEKSTEEVPVTPAEEVVEETVEETVEEENAEEPAEAPAEQPAEEVAEEPVEEPEQESVEVQEEASAEEAAEEPAEEMVEEPAKEPVYYDPSVPIDYEFTGNGTVSVLSILKEVGAPVNMVLEVTRDTDGWFFATGSSDGDWLLTPFAYFEGIEVSVRAGYYDASNGSITDAVYTLNLSYPDPNAKEEVVVEEAEEIEVTIAVERREGNEIRLFAENLSEEDSEKYSYQWQYSLNNEEWFAVEGATGKDYTFRLDQTNGRYYWRLIVSEKE